VKGPPFLPLNGNMIKVLITPRATMERERFEKYGKVHG